LSPCLQPSSGGAFVGRAAVFGVVEAHVIVRL
jgi:hypothetical protein